MKKIFGALALLVIAGIALWSFNRPVGEAPVSKTVAQAPTAHNVVAPVQGAKPPPVIPQISAPEAPVSPAPVAAAPPAATVMTTEDNLTRVQLVAKIRDLGQQLNEIMALNAPYLDDTKHLQEQMISLGNQIQSAAPDEMQPLRDQFAQVTQKLSADVTKMKPNSDSMHSIVEQTKKYNEQLQQLLLAEKAAKAGN